MTLSSRVPEIGALELLLTVARVGSLGRAAAEHGVSQPAAASRIRNLERTVGVPLIERSAQGSRLTEQGALVVGWARAVVDAAAALDAGISALRIEQDSRIRLACSMTIAEYLMPNWLVELHRRRPDTTVGMQVANSAAVAQLVLEGAADIGFVEGPELPAGVQSRPVGEDELRLVVPPGHPWVRRGCPVPAEELARTPLVSREPGSGTRYTLDSVLSGLPRAAPLLELSSTTAIKAAVEAGLGPAVLSSLTLTDDVAAGRLCVLAVAGVSLRRVLRAVWPTGKRLPAVLRDVVAATRTHRDLTDRPRAYRPPPPSPRAGTSPG
jgi:DNA-binding transcriptional LysR family regulator